MPFKVAELQIETIMGAGTYPLICRHSWRLPQIKFDGDLPMFNVVQIFIEYQKIQLSERAPVFRYLKSMTNQSIVRIACI